MSNGCMSWAWSVMVLLRRASAQRSAPMMPLPVQRHEDWPAEFVNRPRTDAHVGVTTTPIVLAWDDTVVTEESHDRCLAGCLSPLPFAQSCADRPHGRGADLRQVPSRVVRRASGRAGHRPFRCPCHPQRLAAAGRFLGAVVRTLHDDGAGLREGGRAVA